MDKKPIGKHFSDFYKQKEKNRIALELVKRSGDNKYYSIVFHDGLERANIEYTNFKKHFMHNVPHVNITQNHFFCKLNRNINGTLEDTSLRWIKRFAIMIDRNATDLKNQKGIKTNNLKKYFTHYEEEN